MAEASDIIKAYDSLQTTWERIRADVWSHLFVGTILFGLVRLPWQSIALPSIDPVKLSENPWFKLAKDLNVLLLIPVIIAVGLFVYGLLLRTVGNFVVIVLMTFWTPKIPQVLESELVSPESLTTIASTLGTATFDAGTFYSRFFELMQKYLLSRKTEFQTALDSTQGMSRAARTYLANSGFFLMLWLTSFVVLPRTSEWRQAAWRHFWLGTVILVLLLLWARIRFVNGISLQYSVLTTTLTMFVASDPDSKHVLALSSEERQAIVERVRKLQAEERKKAADRKSEPFRYRLEAGARSLYSVIRIYLRGGP